MARFSPSGNLHRVIILAKAFLESAIEAWHQHPSWRARLPIDRSPMYTFKSTTSIFIVIISVFCLTLASCTRVTENTPVPDTVVQTPVPSLSSSGSTTPVPTPTSTVTSTPIPTLGPLALSTMPPGAELRTFTVDPNRTGWLGSRDGRAHWSDRNLPSGIIGGQSFLSLIQFDLQTLAPNSKILFAALEIAGRDATNLGTAGEWSFDFIDSTLVKSDDVSFDTVSKVSALATIGSFGSQNVGAGLTKRLVFSPAQLSLIEKQLESGKITFRLRGPSSGSDNQFVWEGGPGRGEPTLSIVVIPTPFQVVSATSTPQNVFAAATLVAYQTLQARTFGTPTSLPRLFATATRGIDYVVVTSVPTEVNPAVAAATSAYATAVAATTGTFTPYPPNWATTTPLPILIPAKSLTPVPTSTPTISPLSITDLAKKSLPGILYNKIAFLNGSRAAPQVWVMDPDGSNLALLTDRTLYDVAVARERVSPDGAYLLYNASDDSADQIVQIWRAHLKAPWPPEQLTFHQAGKAFSPAWSPDGTKIAYTRVLVDGSQEIFLFDLKDPTRWPRLTFSQDSYLWNQNPSWSPDGKQIVFSSDRGHKAAFTEIWIMNADGTSARNLGDGMRDAWAPVWIKWRQ